MDGDADVAAAAALIGEPARAALLLALTEEGSLPARELAARVHIAPSTASGHLARLVEGALRAPMFASEHEDQRNDRALGPFPFGQESRMWVQSLGVQRAAGRHDRVAAGSTDVHRRR